MDPLSFYPQRSIAKTADIVYKSPSANIGGKLALILKGGGIGLQCTITLLRQKDRDSAMFSWPCWPSLHRMIYKFEPDIAQYLHVPLYEVKSCSYFCWIGHWICRMQQTGGLASAVPNLTASCSITWPSIASMSDFLPSEVWSYEDTQIYLTSKYNWS